MRRVDKNFCPQYKIELFDLIQKIINVTKILFKAK